MQLNGLGSTFGVSRAFTTCSGIFSGRSEASSTSTGFRTDVTSAGTERMRKVAIAMALRSGESVYTRMAEKTVREVCGEG